MRIEIQLRIVDDDNSVISADEVLYFNKSDDESNRNRGSLLRLRWRGVESDPRWRAWPDTKW
jgi:hypothetical protein